MKLTISFTDPTCTVAIVREHRWWRRDRQYTAALYGNTLWVSDDDNRPVSERVADEIDRLRLFE